MNTSGKMVLKRIMAVFLSLALALSSLTLSPREAQAGLVVNLIGCKWSAIALNTVERSLLWGIGKAESAAQNDALASALSMTKRIIGGNAAIVAGQTLKEVKHISAQLSALYSYTVSSTNQIEDMIKSLASNEAKANFNSNAASPVDSFTNQYDRMVSEFNNLLEAYAAYGDEPNDVNRSALETYYNTIYNNYYLNKNMNDQVYSLFTRPLMGDATTIGFLPLISPYNPNQNISNASDMTDGWERRSGAGDDTTYLGYYFNYITTVTDFQNNVYDSMRDAACIVDNATYLYLQAYRFYCEFGAMLIASDASLSESQQRQQTTALWNGFYDTAYKVVRGINQMYDTQSTVFNTYMRTWDVKTSKRIQNYRSPIPFGELLHEYEDANGYSGIDFLEPENVYAMYTRELYTDVIQEYQHVYQFRLVSNSQNTYAIRSSTGSTSEEDEASRAFYAVNLQMKRPNGDDSFDGTITCPSTDLLTALKGLEGGFKAPASMSELSPIAAGPAYQSSRLLTENIQTELSFGLEDDDLHLPAVDYTAPSSDGDAIKRGPNFLALRSEIYIDLDTSLFRNYDADMTLGNASMPYSAGNQTQVDLEDDIWDDADSEGDRLDGKEVVFMWYGEPSATIGLSASEGGTTKLKVGDEELGNGQSGTYNSGTAATISAAPQEGYIISSVQLLDASGNVLEDLFSNRELDEETTITTQEMLDFMEAEDEDGSYSFAIPVPYQDATVQVTYAPQDETLKAYNVELSDVKSSSGYDAVLQFGSYDYLGKKSFKVDDQVVVSACGYNHHVAKGLLFYDASGTAMDVEFEDVSNQMLRTRPTERLYAFTMPAQDLNISPDLAESRSVSVVDSSHVSHRFEGLNLFDGGSTTDWAHANSVDFVEGDTVTLSYQTQAGFMVSQVEVFDSSNEAVPTMPADGSVSFVMPASNVTVRFSEESIDTHKRVLALDSVPGHTSLQFLNEHEENLNLVKKQFAVGETVQVGVSVDPNYVFVEMSLVEKGASANTFAAQNGTYDAETGKATLEMPQKDATLGATVRDPTPEEKDGFNTDEEGRILIASYEDLVKFSNAIRKNPEHYTVVDLTLINNINATGKDAWTQGIGSLTDKIYYNGTFEGGGYCIFGMDVSTDGEAGLFEVIGEEGVVRNLFLFDCDWQVHSLGGGGVASINYGRIEHCVNGINLTNGVYIRPKTGEIVSLKEYNSFVDSNYAGGIVGINYGTVYACRSAAEVQALYYAGGIVGSNRGTISNCAANGKVSSSAWSHDKYSHYGAGGICAENDVLVEGGYSSATVSSEDCSGNITGLQYGTITDTYYTTSENQQLAEDFSGNTETNVNGLARGNMMDDSFVQMLSDTPSNSVTWIRRDTLNAGLPRIKNPSVNFVNADFKSNGVSITGNLHSAASMEISSIESDSEAWKLLAQDADGYTASVAYTSTIEDAAGNHIPSDLWAQSALTYRVPVQSPNVAINALMVDGSTQRLDSVEITKEDTGYAASFATDGVAAFMVLDKGADATGTNGSAAAKTTSGSTTTAKTTPRTGDTSCANVWLVLFAGFSALLVVGGMRMRTRR